MSIQDNAQVLYDDLQRLALSAPLANLSEEDVYTILYLNELHNRREPSS